MFSKLLADKKLILASGSPRRGEYFRTLGVPFEVRVSDADEEDYPANFDGKQIAEALALRKNEALGKLFEGEIVVSADTVVWASGQSLAKPVDAKDAHRMLALLSGNVHEVITGVCIRSRDKTEVFSCTTRVFFRPLTDEQITYYIGSFKPYDKAGAYGIQEWVGMVGIEKIEGSYTNVVGLPVAQLCQKLADFVS